MSHRDVEVEDADLPYSVHMETESGTQEQDAILCRKGKRKES
jgi:hypothetical protein